MRLNQIALYPETATVSLDVMLYIGGRFKDLRKIKKIKCIFHLDIFQESRIFYISAQLIPSPPICAILAGLW